MTTIPDTQSPWMDEQTTADYLRISRHTLRQWRKDGRMPPYVRAGVRVLYNVRDVDQWLRQREVCAA